MKRASSEDYDNSYFTEKCEGAEDFNKGIFSERFYKAFRLGDIKKGDLVLDVAAGRGEIAILAARAGAKVTVIDYSKSSVELIKSNAKKFNLASKIKAELMDVRKLSFKENEFDKIFFMEILEHLYPSEVDAAISGMKKILKPGGKIIITTGPNKLLIDSLFLLSKIFIKNNNWESRKYHVNERTFFSLEKLLKKHHLGYKIRTEEDLNWFYGQICQNKTVSPTIKLVVKAFNVLYDQKAFRTIRKAPYLNRIFGNAFLVEATK